MNDSLPSSPSTPRTSGVALIAAGALAMSYGWGFRGDYGHECGAMVPGALLGMAVCLCSGREDWLRRTAIAGWLGAIGWGFGGQVSYGMIPSYTISDSFPDVFYGYGCLFIVGALWGGIGASFLSFAWTKPREELSAMVGPGFAVGALWSLIGLLLWFPEHLAATYGIEPLKALGELNEVGQSPPAWLALAGALEGVANSFYTFTVDKMHDVDWLGATSALIVAGICAAFSKRSRKACGLITLLAMGWWLGYILLSRLLDLHMQPKPGGAQRSDNWAGMVGLLAALALHLWRTENRAGLLLAGYGIIGGGIGFSVGDFINKPDKIRWEPFYQFEFLRGFDHWKWTEQSFGLIMGGIVSLGVLHFLRSQLSPPEEEEESSPAMTADEFSIVGLLIVTFWWNFMLNSRNLYENERITHDTLLGLRSPVWIFLFGCSYVGLVIYLLFRNRREPLAFLPSSCQGRGQLLFVFFLWVTVVAVVSKAWPLASRGALFVHGSFCATAMLCSWIVLTRPKAPSAVAEGSVGSENGIWRIPTSRLILWPLVCVIVLVVLSTTTMKMQDGPGNGYRYRFGPEADHLRDLENR